MKLPRASAGAQRHYHYGAATARNTKARDDTPRRQDRHLRIRMRNQTSYCVWRERSIWSKVTRGWLGAWDGLILDVDNEIQLVISV